MTIWGTPRERFDEKVERSDGCWNWKGGKKKAGYGQFVVNRHKVIAHRWSYEHFIGPIPPSYEIDHTCRNKSCVNPAHLETVTLEENRRRRKLAKTHCVNNHVYTEESTYTWTDPRGYPCRRCRTCNTASARRYAASSTSQ